MAPSESRTFLIGVVLAAVVAAAVVVFYTNPDTAQTTPWTASNKSAPRRVLLESAQEQLDFIRAELSANPVTNSHASKLPASATELEGVKDDVSADPVARAASWLIHTDPQNDELYLTRRFALAVIYYNNGGDQWTDNTGWLSDSLHCEWKGVECCSKFLATPTCALVDRNEIAELDFYKNNLTGNLHDILALLTDVRSVFFSKNSISGPINHAALGSLPKLIKLYLQHNQLTGTVPGGIRQNELLDTLYVQGNNLNGTWPSELCPRCPTCAGKVEYFGVDCDEVECPESCCRYWEHCFYGNS